MKRKATREQIEAAADELLALAQKTGREANHARMDAGGAVLLVKTPKIDWRAKMIDALTKEFG